MSEQVQPNNATEQVSPKPLPLRAKAPSPSSRLNRKAVMIVIAVLVGAVGLSVVIAFSPGNHFTPSEAKDYRPPSPGEAVKNLPSDYSAIKRPPKLGPPLKGEFGATELAFKNSQREETDEEKLERELRLTRIKQATLARSADVSFPGINLSHLQAAGASQQSYSSSGPSSNSNAPLGLAGSPRDDDNRQDDKSIFLYSSRSGDEYLQQPLISPASRYQLMAGTIVPGVLISGVNSDLPGQILGQVSQNVFDTVSGRYLLLPQGTKVVGEYDSRIVYGQERVLIVWTRLLFPNGRSISLEGMPGIDLSGYAGLSERVNNHYLRLLSGVLLGSLLGAGAQVAQGDSQTINPSFEQLALQGAAQNINQAGQQITRKNLNVQPTLEISPGHRFNIFLTKDVILEKYKP